MSSPRNSGPGPGRSSRPGGDNAITRPPGSPSGAPCGPGSERAGQADGDNAIARSPGSPSGDGGGPQAEALFGPRAEQARRYADLLATTGVARGLIGPAEANRVWSRHLFNSAAAASLIGPGASLLDVGSGAGLPGLPLALARPDLAVVLLEPMLRRVQFLEEAVAILGLTGQVTVVRGRAEEAELTADVVVARAVAPLDRLVAWTRPLFPTGELLAWKGDKAEVEVAAASPALARWGLRAEIVRLGGATLVRVSRPGDRARPRGGGKGGERGEAGGWRGVVPPSFSDERDWERAVSVIGVAMGGCGSRPWPGRSGGR